MKIKQAELYHIQLPMKFPFVTGFGAISKRDAVLLKLTDENGLVGWGEASALWAPVYLEEDAQICWHVMSDLIIPLILNVDLEIDDYLEKTAWIRGNNMARFGVETALWSIKSQKTKTPIYKLLGGVRTKIPVGESIGIVVSTNELMSIVENRVSEGYQRIKLKIKPGHDYDYLCEVRKAYPKLAIMVDGNSSYTLRNLNDLKRLDNLNLLMIEQPLGYDDIIDHAKLQKELKTSICLDESIMSAEDARKACEIGACRIINVKPGRVGSLVECQKINNIAKKYGVKLWLGGMLETGIAKSYNLMVAALSEFTLPADVSSSKKFYDDDVTNPDIEVTCNGEVAVPMGVGIGVGVNKSTIKKYQLAYEKIISNE